MEEWPDLDEEMPVASRGGLVFFTRYPPQGLLAHGEHLTRRCQGWTIDMKRQWGWCPEVA